jgi:hypothetical protein
MKNRISLRLDEPCKQKWSEMTPVNNGRYCDSCEKTVIDFSLMTDNEILQFLAEKKTGFCGQFRASQLDRPFVETKLNGGAPRLNSFFAGLAIAGAAGSLSAQSADTTNAHPVAIIDYKQQTGALYKPRTAADTNDLVLNVTVTDTTNHHGIQYATIQILQGGASYTAITDSAGNATVTIPFAMLQDTVTMNIRRAGYRIEPMSIQTQERVQQINIGIGESELMMLGGPMMIVEPTKTKKKKK